MSDAPGPWRRIDGEHFQRCGAYGAHVWRYKPRDRPNAAPVYRWGVFRTVNGYRPGEDVETGAAPTLAAAKRAATAALIRHAPMPF